MKIKTIATRSGAAAPGFLDILSAAVLLAILLWAAWKQFPVYDRVPEPAPTASANATPAQQGASH